MRFSVLVVVACIASAWPDAFGQQQTACSPVNRARNLNRCLAAIRFNALDLVNSPYGESYFNRCPPEDRFSVNCFESPRLDETKSIAQLTLDVDSPDLSGIDRFMSVQFISRPGSYSGCDHTHSYPNTKSFFIDPLSDTAYPSWDLRERPVVHWDYNEGEFFTLIAVDPAGANKGVVSNIRGNDFSEALVLFRYDGPRTFHQNIPRLFVFTLYRQTREVIPERIPSSGFNVTDFAERNQLQGPIALSMVKASYDPYSVSLNPWGENCASLVQDRLNLDLPGISWLPDNLDLSVNLRVRFTTTPATYNCGDYTVTRPAEDFYLDSIDPESNILDTADLRLDSRRTFTFTMNNINPTSRDFNGKLHTLMLISQGGMPHDLIINVQGDNVTIEGARASSGNNLVGYQPPNPTEAEGSQYLIYMLFEQEGRLPTNIRLAPYLNANGQFTNLNNFRIDHHLTTVGVARMLVTFDEYSRCNQSTSTMAAQC